MLRDKIFLALEKSLSREENCRKLQDDFALDAVDRLAAEIERLADV
jgi:hypothetical protein